MITQSKVIKYLKILVINFLISFTLFSVLYIALSEFNPFITLSSKLNDEYLYTFNKNYDELYSEEELEKASYYYFDYEEDNTILYLNENGLKEGVPTIYNVSNILLFPISTEITINENTKYSIDNFNVYNNGTIETNIGYATVSIDYIVLDNEIGTKEVCDFCIYPEKYSANITITSSTSYDYISKRGRDIKLSILSSQSTVGQLLILVAAIPIIILLLSSFFFYNFEMMKEQNYIYINYLFYKKKTKIKLKSFAEIFIPTIIAYTLSSIITYFVFLRSQILLLILPLLLMIVITFIYSAIVTNIIVNKIIKRKGV